MKKDPTQAGAGVFLTPRRGALLAGQDNALEVLIQCRAPEMPAPKDAVRPPLGIALVLDRSGSMSGHPLEEAKRCCQYVIGRLRPDDRVAVVQFDQGVQVIWPASSLSEVARLRALIDGIHSGGNTNLHGGWLAGAEQLAPFADGRQIQRVILLSDGCANEGVVDPAEITQRCGRLASAGVSTSTYGLGRDFNEALMVAMAEAGHGNHYYGATAEDLFEPFNQELDLLSSLWGRNVKLTVRAAPGIDVRMLNAHPTMGGEGGWQLPDIAFGSEAWALLRLRIPQRLLAPAAGSLIEISVEGLAQGGGVFALEGRLGALPDVTVAAYGAVAEDPVVVQRADEIEASAMLIRCREAADRNDWSAVDALLAEASGRFGQSPWVSGVIDTMTALARRRERERLMKDSMYTSMNMSRRLRAPAEVPSLSAEMGVPSFLRRKMSSGTAEYIKADEGEKDAE